MSYLSIHYLDRGRFYYLQQDLGGSLSTFCHCPEQICLPIFMTDIFKHRSQSLCGPLQPDPIRRITSFFPVNCLLKEANNIQRPRTLRISNQRDMYFLLTPSLDGSTGFHNSSKELTFQILGQTSPGRQTNHPWEVPETNSLYAGKLSKFGQAHNTPFRVSSNKPWMLGPHSNPGMYSGWKNN